MAPEFIPKSFTRIYILSKIQEITATKENLTKVQPAPLNSQPRTDVLGVADLAKVQPAPHGHSQNRTSVLTVAAQLFCSL